MNETSQPNKDPVGQKSVNFISDLAWNLGNKTKLWITFYQ